MSRAAIAILSTENLLHNLDVLRARSGGAGIIAMIKANAYGHGLRSVALRLEGKVQALGVASIDEAIALRKAGVKAPITLMEGVFEPDELLLASCQGFDVVIHDPVQIQWLLSSSLPVPLRIWIKVDTGMGRLGFLPDEAINLLGALSSCVAVRHPVGLMSHFACAEDVGNSLNDYQMNHFKALANSFYGPKSFANSAAILNLPQSVHDFVRPGLALYGVSPVPGLFAKDFHLKPVMTLQTRLISIRNIKAGSTIGYGGHFVCPEDMPVGVIAMGYGDGYPANAPAGTPILVSGIRCNLAGRVSMDMMTIDLRTCPNALPGDPVILWGQGLPVEEIASHTGRIAYDLLCSVQSRVKFHWTMP